MVVDTLLCLVWVVLGVICFISLVDAIPRSRYWYRLAFTLFCGPGIWVTLLACLCLRLGGMGADDGTLLLLKFYDPVPTSDTGTLKILADPVFLPNAMGLVYVCVYEPDLSMWGAGYFIVGRTEIPAVPLQFDDNGVPVGYVSPEQAKDMCRQHYRNSYNRLLAAAKKEDVRGV